jgi:hypothetical protein
VVLYNHLETYESQWEGLSHIYIMENKECSKPPTRDGFIGLRMG